MATPATPNFDYRCQYRAVVTAPTDQSASEGNSHTFDLGSFTDLTQLALGQ